MGFGLTAAAVAEYAAKPFVQRALSLPRTEGALNSIVMLHVSPFICMRPGHGRIRPLD